MRRWTMLGCVLLTVVAAAAREGIVTTRDGRTIQGDVTETDTGVSINVHGVVMNIAQENVSGVEYPESIEAQYQQRLGELKADDVAGRLELSRWAFENQAYELARDAAQQALDIDPNSAEAVTMLETIRVQMRMEQSRSDAPPAEDAGTDEPVDEPAAERRPPRKLLTDDDVNRIRQLELSPEDEVRVRLDNDVERRFVSAEGLEPGRFRNLRPVQKAVRILTEGDADFADDVRILSDPSSLMEFRRLVQPLVLNGCAITGCHGTGAQANPVLFSPADTDQATYTNFYILHQYRRPSEESAGVFGSGERGMIDRANPEDSLLLEYGLPAEMAKTDHPAVRGLRPIFRNRQDPRYQQVSRWMSQSLNPVDPDYGIEYAPPAPRPPAEAPPAAGTQPATEPVAE